MQKDVNTIFLNLVKLGIGHYAGALDESVCWKEIQNLAEEHGLYAVVLDGIERLPKSSRPNQEFLLEWIGEVLQGYEYRYEQYRKAISELAGFYNSHGFKMMVLKGYACSLDWPKPSHRPCGDIDIWQFGKQKEADETLRQAQGPEFKIDKGHHHHTVFNWMDFSVENHYDFVNVHDYQSSKEIEIILKELGQDDSYPVAVNGENVYLPSPNLHALFLLRHMVSHFSSTSITYRQLLDWAFFVEKHTEEIDWEWLYKTLKQYNMMEFTNCINAICVEELGFSPTIFSNVQFNPSLKEKIVEDIQSPSYEVTSPALFIPRIVYKYRRWKSNAWKRKLCYKEGKTVSFLKGVWLHLTKPASI